MGTKEEQPFDTGVSIGFRGLFRSLWSVFPILVLCMMIGALIGYLYSTLLITPLYSSSTKIYVMANDELEKRDAEIDNGALQAGALLTKDYEQIIESPEVVASVISSLNLRDGNGKEMSNDELKGKMEVTIPEETRVVIITVTDTDPYRASDIANAFRKISIERIQRLLDVKAVRTVSIADIPVNPGNVNKTLNIGIGGLIGFVLALDAALIYFVTNNKIRSGDDVQKYLGVSVLAAIPKVNESNMK